MKLRRKPRKTMKLADAMPLLQLSRSGLRDQIFKYKKLREAPRRGSNTSPIVLYEAEVLDLAREWGIL